MAKSERNSGATAKLGKMGKAGATKKVGNTAGSATRAALAGSYVTKGVKRAAKKVLPPVEKKVSASVLHHSTRPTLNLLQTSDAVAVTHYNEVEGYLVAPETYTGLVERVQQADARESELSSTVTLLLAAAHAGVPIPSDMLQRVMPNVDVAQRWREIAEFAATFPFRINAGEHGEPITRASLSHVGRPIEESGSDDDLDLG